MKWLIIANLIAFSHAVGLLGRTNIRQVTNLESAEAEPIAPYSFSYVADATDGQSAREESSDGSGVVRGSYTLSSADGTKRTVNYIADENGFRAQVQTNEPGTESHSPSDVQFESSQPPAEQIALKFGPKPNLELRLPANQNLLKGLPKPLGFGQVIKQQFTPVLKQKSLIGLPLAQKIETGLPALPLENTFSQGFQSSLRTQFKPIDTPLTLLTKPIAPKISSINSGFNPSNFEAQQREELVQNRENY